MRQILILSRYVLMVAVVSSLAAALLLLVYASIAEIRILLQSFSNLSIGDKEVKALSLSLINIIDFFLLATGFYIIALGLYELFIDDSLELPEWLIFHNFDDLKNMLISIVIVVMSVTFLSQVVKWDGSKDILEFGIAVGVVIAALAYFLNVKYNKVKPNKEEKG